MKPFSAQDLADATSGELYGIAPDTQLSAGVVTDSRDVSTGDVYVARRGDQRDGLDFAPAALAAGASLIVAEAVPTVDGEHLPTLVVQDATEALGRLARLNVEALRESGDLTVVAITSTAHSRASRARHPDGLRLLDVADIVLDTGAPVGDVTVQLPGGVETGPVSTLLSTFLLHSLAIGAMEELVAGGEAPPVLRSMNRAGGDDSNAAAIAPFRDRLSRDP